MNLSNLLALDVTVDTYIGKTDRSYTLEQRNVLIKKPLKFISTFPLVNNFNILRLS